MDFGIYKDNISARTIISNVISKCQKPINKYNLSLLQETEELSGEPSDRTAYDVGEEPEK